jgi:hypothetical protein
MLSRRIPFVATLLMMSFIMLIIRVQVQAQVVQVGIKGGANMSWVHEDDPDFRKTVKANPVYGFNAGAVISFKMKKNFFLHTELLYSTKGRELKGTNAGDKLVDKATFNFIEIPLIYNIQFKSKVGNGKQFKWYAGIGPNFSYWLGGKGYISNAELTEYEIPRLDYKIRFGERSDADGLDPHKLYYQNANRFQLGINVGGGILLEPANTNSKVMLDLRFELGHSWLGQSDSSIDQLIPAIYHDNLRARNMGLRLSAMYLFEYNLSKKERKKGKSTKRRL